VQGRVYNKLNDDETSISVIAGCDIVLMVQFRYFSSETLHSFRGLKSLVVV